MWLEKTKGHIDDIYVASFLYKEMKNFNLIASIDTNPKIVVLFRVCIYV